MMDAFVAPMELKLADAGTPGQIEGYGAVFGNVDSHGDVILPGAFAAALEQHKAAGTMPAMYVEHGPALGGSSLPDGIWDEMTEDEKGLRVKGRILALDTDHGRRIHSLAGAGALKGLSIGYRVGSGNAVFGKGPGQPKRQIKAFERLFEVSLVTSPSNGRAQIESVKAVLGIVDRDRATQAAVAALALHGVSMAGGDSPTAAERADMLGHLQDVHEALTGQRMPTGLKAAPATIREFEKALREIGFSNSQATDIATRGFKSSAPRDGAVETAIPADVAADIGALSGFSLPRF